MGFAMPHMIILIAGGAVGLALILQIVGAATPGWATKEVSTRVHGIVVTIDASIGLWKSCQGDVCATISFGRAVDLPAWFNACRAFSILGILVMAASLACTALICFLSDKAKMFALVAMAAAAAGAGCTLIEFAVFAGENPWTSSLDFDLGYSFGLTIVACLLCVASTLLFLLGRGRLQ
ncbi:uncharacterized protein LOC143291141 [Babylonia areolata]|uniref:uncharacterized protein LOC143291141 n=1 Tax=Babylonia areolata TaxID=304850 RepID=UPI003FD5410A